MTDAIEPGQIWTTTDGGVLIKQVRPDGVLVNWLDRRQTQSVLPVFVLIECVGILMESVKA